MSSWTWFALSGVAVFGVAVYGLFTAPGFVRKLIAANLMGSGVFLVLIASARRAPEAPDPIPHALVLTGIVVSVSATALALALTRRLQAAAHAEANHPSSTSHDDGAPTESGP